MTNVTLSPKFQVVIPKDAREIIQVDIGMKFAVIPYNNRLELIPIRPIKTMKGFLKGMNTDNIREKQDRKL